MIMRLYSEAIFYLNGAQQLTFLKNNELYKQCRERLLSSSAMQLPGALSMLAGCPAVWPLTADTPSLGWLVESFVPSFTSTHLAMGGAFLPEFSM